MQAYCIEQPPVKVYDGALPGFLLYIFICCVPSTPIYSMMFQGTVRKHIAELFVFACGGHPAALEPSTPLPTILALPRAINGNY